MTMYKKLDCICGHEELTHHYVMHAGGYDSDDMCSKNCLCEAYDASGKNPDVYNIICPRCHLSWMNKIINETVYFCYACSFILFESQIKILLK